MKPVYALRQDKRKDSKLEISREMTIKGKKNSKIKIITNKKKYNYWKCIFRRKRVMSEYFSDSAFGSQSDTKIEFYPIWLDPKMAAKYRVRLIIDAHEYNEDNDNKISFMHNDVGQNNTEEE